MKVTDFSQNIWQKNTRNIHLRGHLFEAFASWAVNLERKQTSIKQLKSKSPAFRIYLKHCGRKQVSPVYCNSKTSHRKERKDR